MISIQDAQRGTQYICPECRGDIVFRAGSVKVPHFVHKKTPDKCRFINEGWLHISAKHAVFNAVCSWLNGKTKSPIIKRTCRTCRHNIEQSLPSKVVKTILEYRISICNSICIADVALLDQNNLLLCVVEIKDTHEVDSIKNTKLGDIPWIELDAQKALENPMEWKPLVENNFKKFRCRCDTAEKIPIIQRGLAVHVDYCPIKARVWKGKPYANVIDDCWAGCEHFVGQEGSDKYGNASEILCSGKTKRE